jgi:hypothetical protein
MAQPWTWTKESDGVTVYTRYLKNSPLKAYKGETVFEASADSVCSMLGNPDNSDWWDKEISHVRVLDYKKDDYVRYYLVYNLPWPLTNRDLVAETQVKPGSASGEYVYLTNPVRNQIPEDPDRVRIRKYQQKWTVEPVSDHEVKVTLEGFLDPGGNIPAWIFNMVVADAPVRAIKSLRERVLAGRPIQNRAPLK